MTCISCKPTKKIPTCISEIVIGTIVADMDYLVYIENNNTGYILKLPCTSDVDGLLTLDLSEIDTTFFSPNNKYKLTVTLADAAISDILDITLADASVVNCLLLLFAKSFDNEGLITSQESATLELDLTCECP